MRKWRARAVAAAGLVVVATAGSVAMASEDTPASQEGMLLVGLSGYQEDPNALSTTGAGQFRARIDDGQQLIEYELGYSDLEGTVTQAHIHLGGRAQSGGISVFLCTNLGNGPAGTQACPAAPATITGTLRPADVIGPTGQGIAAGEFAELVAAIRSGTTYVNVHTVKYPGGEIRAQLDHQH